MGVFVFWSLDRWCVSVLWGGQGLFVKVKVIIYQYQNYYLGIRIYFRVFKLIIKDIRINNIGYKINFFGYQNYYFWILELFFQDGLKYNLKICELLLYNSVLYDI